MSNYNKKIKVCVIGGGTGSLPVLGGLKTFKDILLSVIVTMTDDGGSNAVVRDEFGLLPLSDLRKSIIALSRTPNGYFRELFVYRFDKGMGLKGHTLGNLIMTALSNITGSEEKAILATRKLFKIKEQIIPVTLDKVRLTAEYNNGDIVQGEHLIDETITYKEEHIKRLFLSPQAKINKKAKIKVLNSDFIIIGPGDLYTSTLPNFIVKGMLEVIKKTPAKLILVSNLMTKAGQTRGMRLSKFIGEAEKYIGRKVDYIIHNDGELNKSALSRYYERGEKIIRNDIKGDTRLFLADVVASDNIPTEKGDELERSLLRHDRIKLAKVLYQIIKYGKLL